MLVWQRWFRLFASAACLCAQSHRWPNTPECPETSSSLLSRRLVCGWQQRRAHGLLLWSSDLPLESCFAVGWYYASSSCLKPCVLVQSPGVASCAVLCCVSVRV